MLFYGVLFILCKMLYIWYNGERETGVRRYEAHISATQYEKKENTRIQKSNENKEWPIGSKKEESEGQKTPGRLAVERRLCRMASRTLRSERQFRLVYNEGKREAGRNVIIYHLKTGNDGILPGFVASKKIGKAFQRNRAKRQMREIFGKLKRRINEKNLWIVFIASFRPGETSFQKLLEDVESSLGRAGLISHYG